MGRRKKNNAIRSAAEKIARPIRARRKTARATAPKNPGQKLHDLMHGR